MKTANITGVYVNMPPCCFSLRRLQHTQMDTRRKPAPFYDWWKATMLYMWNRNTNNKNNSNHKSNERSVPYAFFFETAGACSFILTTWHDDHRWKDHCLSCTWANIAQERCTAVSCVNDNLSTYHRHKNNT